DPEVLAPLAREMEAAASRPWDAAPIVGGVERSGNGRPVSDPADRRRTVGHVVEATADDVEQALARASRAVVDWDAAPAESRAACLERAADIMEAEMPALMAIAVREAGKTLGDAVAEVREAIDFCRYYAARARADFAVPLPLPGPTGERNQIALAARG